MIKRLFSISIGLFFFSSGIYVRAQEAPAASTLLRSWTDSQRAFGNDFSEVEFIERAAFMLDGHRGRQRFRIDARMRGRPGTDQWERELLTVSMNDRSVPRPRWGQLERRRQAITGGPLNQLIRVSFFSLPWLERLQSRGPVREEIIDDLVCWRVDLVPYDPSPPVDGVTLWFDRQYNQLVRSSVSLHRPMAASPVTAVTEYEHVNGYDLPRRRHIEGTVQTSRRRRYFTEFFTISAEYDQYRFNRLRR